MTTDIVVYSKTEIKTEIDGRGTDIISLYIKDEDSYVRVFMNQEQLATLGAQIGEALKISTSVEQTVTA